MGLYCTVLGCRNVKGQAPGISFHKYPQDPKLRKKWIQRIRKNVQWKKCKVSNYMLVCSEHFVSSDYVKLGINKVPRLKKGAVPSKFNFPGTVKKNRPHWTERKQRRNDAEQKYDEVRPSCVTNGDLFGSNPFVDPFTVAPRLECPTWALPPKNSKQPLPQLTSSGSNEAKPPDTTPSVSCPDPFSDQSLAEPSTVHRDFLTGGDNNGNPAYCNPTAFVSDPFDPLTGPDSCAGGGSGISAAVEPQNAVTITNTSASGHNGFTNFANFNNKEGEDILVTHQSSFNWHVNGETFTDFTRDLNEDEVDSVLKSKGNDKLHEKGLNCEPVREEIVASAHPITISSDKHRDKLVSGLWKHFQAKFKLDGVMKYHETFVRVHQILLDIFLEPNHPPRDIGRNMLPESCDQPKIDCLEMLVEFMYLGRVEVPADQIQDLLTVAKDSNFQLLVDAIHTSLQWKTGDNLATSNPQNSVKNRQSESPPVVNPNQDSSKSVNASKNTLAPHQNYTPLMRSILKPSYNPQIRSILKPNYNSQMRSILKPVKSSKISSASISIFEGLNETNSSVPEQDITYGAVCGLKRIPIVLSDGN